MDPAVKILADIPLFSSLSEEERAALVKRAGRLRLKAGAVVVEEGDEGSALYVIEEGRVVVQRSMEGKTRSIVGRMGAGEYFGEYSLFDREPRSAAVVAEGDAVVLQLEADELLGFLDQRPRAAASFYKALVVMLVERLRSSSERLTAALQWGLGVSGLDEDG